MPDVRRGLGRRPFPEASRANPHWGASVRVPDVSGGAHRRAHATQTHGQVPRRQPAREDHAGEGYAAVPQPGHTGGARRQHPGLRPAPRAQTAPAATLRGDRNSADHRGDSGGHAGGGGGGSSGGGAGRPGGERRLCVHALGPGHHAGCELCLGPTGSDRNQTGGRPRGDPDHGGGGGSCGRGRVAAVTECVESVTM